ncbi:MAG: choline ABC transporter ATP-binding protein [Parvibaculaceae bacterium]|nr:choline ABC transporter ATP-binding protein [Parvibaculaceae bacterium]
MTAVEFWGVDILFGGGSGRPGTPAAQALDMLDEGRTRDEIIAETGVVVGVKNANLKVEEGEICVLMGLSGSGKSTLLRAVNGLNKVTRGRIMVRHGDKKVDVASCDAATLRVMRTQRIAMVFQQFALLPWRTVRENVGFGLELRGMSKAERNKIVDEKLKMVGLDKWAEKYASELSGGMQQRVGLARAFATDADILLMDEPFSALDPLIRTKLQDELLDLQKQFQKTIIFVSHDLDEALKLGNRIAILEGGRIVQQGTGEDIVLRPADAYVKEFVQHMNPLNVLKASAVMTPASDMRKLGDAYAIDWQDRRQLTLDADGSPSSATIGGVSAPLVWPERDGVEKARSGDVAVVSPSMLLKDVIELRQITGNSVVFAEQGKMVGSCCEEDILRALSSDAWRETRAAS